MLYTPADLEQARAEQTRRRLWVWLPAALLFAAAILSFVWFRLRHDVSGWWVTGLITILGGAYALFMNGVYLHPVTLYRRHLEYMLGDRLRETTGRLVSVNPVPADHEGLDCLSLVLNVGPADAAEDERLFYLDALKTLPACEPGAILRIHSNNRMVAGIEILPKES